MSPPGASEPASELLLQYLLQHLLVQTQLSDPLLQSLILILRLPQTPQFRHDRPGKFFLPPKLRKAHFLPVVDKNA